MCKYICDMKLLSSSTRRKSTYISYFTLRNSVKIEFINLNSTLCCSLWIKRKSAIRFGSGETNKTHNNTYTESNGKKSVQQIQIIMWHSLCIHSFQAQCDSSGIFKMLCHSMEVYIYLISYFSNEKPFSYHSMKSLSWQINSNENNFGHASL